MPSAINPDTFETAADQPAHGYWIEGTVEFTLRGEARRVKASKSGEAITAWGLTGRYETGTKAWPATVERVQDPRTGRWWDRVNFGRDERSGRCRKVLNQVFFKN